MLYRIIVDVFCGYLELNIKKKIEKNLKPHETRDLRVADKVAFWLKFLEKYKNNVPYEQY